jgi:pimeloyl-ACP methyl ester carboxylesterase
MPRRQLLRVGSAGTVASLVGGTGTAVWTDCIVDSAEERFPPTGTFTSIDGNRVHHVIGGTGPPVVLIHGDGGTVFDWTYSAFDRVAERFRAIAVDRPGFGYSDPPGTLGSPFAQAGRIRAVLEERTSRRPVLVGHSRGASVALAYAATFPDSVTGLVDLAGQPYAQDPTPLHFQALTWPVLGSLLAETVYVPYARGQIASGIRAAFEPEGTPPPDYIDAYVAMERRPGQLRAHAYDSIRAPVMHEQLLPQYDRLECPVAVVHGTADRNVPVEQARRLHRAAPTTELYEIENAGHELAFYHPETLIDAIDWVLATGDDS